MSTSIRTDINTDYSVPDPFQVTFPISVSADTTLNVSGITAMNDLSIEGPHSFNVILQSVPTEFIDSVYLGTTPQTVTIIDDDDGKLVHHTS